MPDTRALLRNITAAWAGIGWTDRDNAALLAARLLSEGHAPQATAKALPASFYAANRTTQRAVSAVLAKAIADGPTTGSSSLSLLFVAASPVDQARLRPGAEQRDIMEKIRTTTLRDRINMQTVMAARPTDLNDAFNRFRPTILHITSHGDPNGIAFEDRDGDTADVSTASLGRIVSVAGPQLRLVVLSTCQSADQAKFLTNHVDAAIGMNDSVGDEAARVFAVQLYSSLGEGVSLQQAFDQAVLQIELHGIAQSDIPKLFVKKRLNAAKYKLLSE